MDIPMSDIQKRLEIMRLEASREAWAGAYRATQQYFSEATNLAQGFENVTTNAFSSMEDAIVDFAMTGKASFSDMTNSIISDLMRIAIRANITGPLAGALGGLFNSGGSTATASVMGNSISGGCANSFVGNTGIRFMATGGVASPAWDLSPSGGLLTRPTYFYDGMNRAYATGGLSVAGEAGPEVYMPAKRMSDGNYGVRVQGVNTAPQVNIQVINQTGTNATAEVQQQRNAQGGVDVVVMLKREMASDIARGGVLDQTIRGRYGVKPIVRGR